MVSQAIVRTQTAEEREYARYLLEVEARKQRAADLQAELEALKIQLGRFEVEYHARVGARFIELDRLRLAISEYEHRIALLESDRTADPARVEADVRAGFAEQREQARSEEEQARRFEQEYQRERQRPALDDGTVAEIGRLYRALAKRYHPDLARSDDERSRRAPLMQRVNAAMRERDLNELRALSREAEANDPTFEARSVGERLVWAIREVARLDEVIAALEVDLVVVRATETHSLWLRQESGEDVLGTLEVELKAQVGTEQGRLAVMIGAYRHLLESRVR